MLEWAGSGSKDANKYINCSTYKLSLQIIKRYSGAKVTVPVPDTNYQIFRLSEHSIPTLPKSCWHAFDIDELTDAIERCFFCDFALKSILSFFIYCLR